jgi:hypothetical protein
MGVTFNDVDDADDAHAPENPTLLVDVFLPADGPQRYLRIFRIAAPAPRRV